MCSLVLVKGFCADVTAPGTLWGYLNKIREHLIPTVFFLITFYTKSCNGFKSVVIRHVSYRAFFLLLPSISQLESLMSQLMCVISWKNLQIKSVYLKLVNDEKISAAELELKPEMPGAAIFRLAIFGCSRESRNSWWLRCWYPEEKNFVKQQLTL